MKVNTLKIDKKLFTGNHIKEEDLNLQTMSFFVVKFDYEVDHYVQCSVRMSLENATKFCESRRKQDPEGDYKVHAELDF